MIKVIKEFQEFASWALVRDHVPRLTLQIFFSGVWGVMRV
jgi:hypothetical protein